MPDVQEIQSMQQALKVAEAQNSLPHLVDVIEALNKPTVTALATLCSERLPQVADQQLARTLNAIANIVNLSGPTLARMKEAAEATIAASEPPASE